MKRVALILTCACAGLVAGCPSSDEQTPTDDGGNQTPLPGADSAANGALDVTPADCDPADCKETKPVPRCGPEPQCTKAGTGICHWGAAHCSDPQPGPGAPVTCGAKTCATGLVCCNASCGICTMPGGACTQMFCEPTEPDGGVPAGTCKTDNDCRLFDDYCTGCDCRALTKSAPDPSCAGPGVRCLRAPCQGESAACEKGKCVVRSAALTRDQ